MEWKEEMAALEITSVGSTRCSAMAGKNPVVIHFPTGWTSQLVVGMTLAIGKFRVVWYEDELHFHCDTNSVIILHPTAKRGEKGIAEAFAGLAGWTTASQVMGREVCVLIEKDLHTAQVCARRFSIPIYTADELIDRILAGEMVSQCVLHDGMENPKTWVACGLLNVGVILASPPCQPWSGAGTTCGLQSQEGQLMLGLVGWAGIMKIECLAIENVPGFRKHADFQLVIDEAKRVGMTMYISDLVQCNRMLPIRRERWIGVLCHCTVPVQAERINSAAAVAFHDQSFKIISRTPGIAEADAMHCNISQDERMKLNITSEMYDAMGNPEYAPGWLKGKVLGDDAEAYVNGRTIHPQEQLGAIMALYGRQHELAHDTLKSRGLHTMVIQDQQGKRLISPWEAVTALGYPSEVTLHADIQKSWTMAGNGISVCHAWMALHKAHILMDTCSPFQPSMNAIDQITQLLDNTIKLSKYETKCDGECWYLVPIADGYEEPSSKRTRFDSEASQTQAFIAQVEVEEASHHLETRFFASAPAFEHFNDPRHVAVQGIVYASGIMIFQHEQKHWAMFINAAVGDTIGAIIEKGLPHAKQSHFSRLTHEGRELAWNVQLDFTKVQTVTFSPVPSMITCVEQSLRIALSLKCDLTWTAKTVLAYWAAKTGCNVDTIKLMHRNRALKDDDYVLEFPDFNFQVAFHASVPTYADVTPNVKQTADPGMATAPSSYTRFYARHPIKKITRTAAVPVNASIQQLVQTLFPDLHATTPWSVFGGAEQVPPDAFASAWSQLTIQWETVRPLQTTEIRAIRHACGWGSPATAAKLALTGIRKWIRSPFQVKASEVLLPHDAVIGELVATFLCHSQLQTSLMCMINGSVIDPMTEVRSIADAHTIDCRICPLLGGAKNDGLKKRVQDMLKDKGVPDTEVAERMTAFLAKCPMEKLSVYKDNDDEQLWINVKALATSAKFRLITPDELKSFQQKQRQNKQSSSSTHVKKDNMKKAKQNRDKPFALRAFEIVIDPRHFAAEGEPIQILDIDRFGPDQAGLCVSSPDQADKLANGCRSSDPLAMLVIGKGAERHGTMFTMPAHTKQGTPVVISACLVQCGDTNIEYVLQLPKVQIAQQASTVKVDTVRDASNQVVQVTTTSRFQELRTEIEEQVANVVDAKLAIANQQIEALTTALQNVQRDSTADLQHLKSEQEFTKMKLGEMEQSMSASNQTILQQMKLMFSTMEQSMSAKIDQAVASSQATPVDPEKRARTEASEPKHDPFSVHKS
eukprot:Skav202771  [mRNA]  locus=scaffold326:290972:295486:- [translate_table: standard]